MEHDMSRLEAEGYNRKKKPNYSKIDELVFDQKKEKKRIDEYLERGTNRKMIEKGIACRLGIIDITEVKMKSDGDQLSFNYGMYYPGEANFQLDSMIRYGFIPGRVKNEIVKKIRENNSSMTEEEVNKLFNDKSYVQNMINNILITTGYRDSNDPLLDFDKLPETVKNNEYYLMGYNKVKGKGVR